MSVWLQTDAVIEQPKRVLGALLDLELHSMVLAKEGSYLAKYIAS